MVWNSDQSERNQYPYINFEVTWIRADESILFSSVQGGNSEMFPSIDQGRLHHHIAKPLFSVKRTVCSGTNSTPNNVNYKGLRALNPNPSTTTDVGNPWRVRKNVWIPIISGVKIKDTVLTKELWVEFVAIVHPHLVEEINSPANLPVDIVDKIAGTPGTGECF